MQHKTSLGLRRFFNGNRVLVLSLVLFCAFALMGPMAEEGKKNAVPGQKMIEMSGSPVRVLLKGEKTYRISLDGKTFSRELPQKHFIRLQDNVFDPITNPPKAAVKVKAGKNLYIVQCITQAIVAYQKQITALGGEISGTLPDNALLVVMPGDTAAKVNTMPFVRWSGVYHADYKLPKGLRNKATVQTESDSSSRYSLYLTKKNKKNEVTRFIESIGGEVTLKAKSRRMEANLNQSQLSQVASHHYVVALEAWTAKENDMDVVREIGGADYLETVESYTGEGVRAEVCDGGLRTTHNDFQANPPVIHGANSSSTSHGTSVYGIVFGDGSADATGRGMIPDAEQPIFSAYNSFSDRYAHTEELVNASGSYRAVFQTNSWGNTRTYDYTTISAEMDEIIFDLDILILQSQSNAGSPDSRPQAWAKNILSIGAVKHYDSLSKTDDCWCSGASIGPASDGRIKPDLCHFYDYTWAPYYSGNTAYSNFGGTSGATPITAGHAGLLYQMWADGVFAGGTGQGRDVFNSRPHATTAKALLIHSAYQYTFSGTNHDLTRVHQGWGMPDVKNLYQMAQTYNWSFPVLIDESSVIAPLETDSYSVTCNGGTPLRATMVYADPAGVPGASVQRINDLSLKVTSPSGTVYWGNNGLNSNMWSTSGGSSNTVDTVENVFIETPEAGVWTIAILADEVVQDGHVETPAIDADYALVVSGGTSGGNQAPNASFNYSKDELVVTFTDQSSDDGTIVSWAWDFGDGNTSTNRNPVHTYATMGTYSVTLTVTDDEGAEGQTTQSILAAPNQAPTAAFGYSDTSLTVTFTDQSTDDGTIASWAWNFGDGNTSTAQNPVHTYAAAGTFTVSLTVTDNKGLSDSTNQNVTVTSGPEVYVYSISTSANKAGRKYSATSNIVIRDTNNNLVNGAVVYITWSGVVSGSVTGTTNKRGKVTFKTSKVSSTGPFTIMVTNVSASLPYNASLNNQTTQTVSY
ncbi:MAG: PKD domain-containing protein [bacterium]|nr:PKD domain-containing protein [bacterium]